MIEKLKTLLLSSGIARVLCIPILFIIFISAATIISKLTAKSPELIRINPPVSAKGEVVAIEGNGFGKEQGDQWIEISGVRISSSSYISWDDNKILFIIPENYEDGLIRVCSRDRQSNMLVFARRENIPEEAKTVNTGNIPVIQSLDASQKEIGKILVISGLNFGITRGNSGVLFTKTQENYSGAVSDKGIPSTPLIMQEETDFGYDFWSDQEIRVRVPDGASSGPIYVKTERGMSSPVNLRIADMPGTKRFENQRLYVISENVDISGITAGNGSKLFLRIPLPVTTASQQNMKIRESSPPPYMENYRGTILHQFENLKTGGSINVNHTIVLTNSDIITTMNVQRIKQYDTSSPVYKTFTEADDLIPAHTEEIKKILAQIPGAGNQNPYRKAKAIYDWILENIKYRLVTDKNKLPVSSLVSGEGDVYDMTIIFCALARTAGIPALPSAGVIVDMQQETIPHWWAEFYIENFGWVPVDLGMAMGIPYESEHNGIESKVWYFGNIDGNRISFSRGWIHQIPMITNGKTVSTPRSFAFQKVWEESNENLTSYASLWTIPKLIGVY